jgi:hypothetical protein
MLSKRLGSDIFAHPSHPFEPILALTSVTSFRNREGIDAYGTEASLAYGL